MAVTLFDFQLKRVIGRVPAILDSGEWAVLWKGPTSLNITRTGHGYLVWIGHNLKVRAFRPGIGDLYRCGGRQRLLNRKVPLLVVRRFQSRVYARHRRVNGVERVKG